MKNLQSSRFSVRKAAVGAGFTAAMIGAVIGGVTLLNVARSDGPEAAAINTLPVKTVRAKRQSGYAADRTFVGRIAAARSSNIGFELAGLLVDVAVTDGIAVKKGQILARLDTAKLNSRRKQLSADLAEVAARLTLALRTEARRGKLVKRGHASIEQYDDAKSQVGSLRARKASIQAAIDSVDIDLRKSILRAPYDGVVAERRVDEGAVVQAGQAILKIYETKDQEARIGVAVRLAAQLKAGDRVRLTVRTGTRRGRVNGINPTMNTSTRTVTVIVVLADGTVLPAGEIVKLRLTEKVAEPGFWVPTSALSEGIRGLWKLYALQPAPSSGEGVMRVVRKEVEILHAGTERVFVRGTVQDGDVLVAAGTHRLVPGQLVRPVPRTAAAD